ncbi:uncharacterized protein (TIGR02271 family) [Sinobaca qinghaiensis]|uniref:Uncharacterized protein (TIGR02271 family) n=1 Tax=Sinobaca qinghaiensis TaxID=342944 RepID=A0A419UWL5_9BACL|nr:YsnF/AvaK domain-containing protein [Sinobaca qinghaiensis]RKD69527.1 uncharacterized protein (TIGR02271 family) [Sinobaca qinghaiensis]
MTAAVHGVYENSQQAAEAIAALKQEGVLSDNISIVLNDENEGSFISKETGVQANVEQTQEKENTSFMDGLKNMFKGSSSDTDSTTHTSATLQELGLSEAEADSHASAVEKGSVIVLTHSLDTAPIDEQEVPPPGNEYTTAEPDKAPTAQNESTEEQVMPLREEQLDVTKKKVDKGEVGVTKEVVEEEQTVSVPVQREEAFIEKRPVDSSETAPPGEIGEDHDEVRMRLTDEEVEIKKTSVVTDEVVVGKRKIQETEEETEHVKREEARINDEGQTTENEDPSVHPLSNKKGNDNETKKS